LPTRSRGSSVAGRACGGVNRTALTEAASAADTRLARHELEGTAKQTPADIVALHGFELDMALSTLRDADGAEVRLRPQSMAVLQILVRHAGRVVTKDELMRTVWAGTVVTDDSLVQCIKEIRQVLRDPDHRIIRTSAKRGYWLVLPDAEGRIPNGNGANGPKDANGQVDTAIGAAGHSVAPGGNRADAHAVAGTAIVVDLHRPDATPNSIPVASDPSRRRFGLGAAALAIGGLSGASGLAWWLSRPPFTGIQAKAEQPSIVVLPIRNISGGERWDRLARGLTEDITTDLARNHWLFIIASSAAFQRAAGGKDALAIARELSVRFVLEGSLQTEGEAVRVNARLLEAGSGGGVWSQRWEKPAGQLFDIQDSIVSAIDNTLGSAWTGAIASSDRAHARRRPTNSLAAYELYLLGVENKHRFNPNDFAKARDHLQRSVQLDPGFAKAWAALAIVQVNLATFAPDEVSREVEVKARRRAISLGHRADPNDPDVLVQYCWLRSADGDLEAALSALRSAVATAPNNADVLIVAALEGSTKLQPADDALAWARRAMHLNPNPPNWYYLGLGFAALYARQYEAAVNALASAPDMPARWYHGAVAHALQGELDAARNAVQRLLALNPGATIRKVTSNRGEWGSRDALALFVLGARLAGIPE